MANYWEGRRLRLRPVAPGDAPDQHAFNESLEYDLVDRRYPPGALDRVTQWATERGQKGFEEQSFFFQMEDLETGALVGSISTHRCDPRVGVLSYGLHVLSGHRGKGYASEAICLVLRFYFQELRYQKANVEVFDLNGPSKALHERLGFVEEGRLRRSAFTRGAWWDVIWYGMTVEEFRDLHPDYWLAPA